MFYLKGALLDLSGANLDSSGALLDLSGANLDSSGALLDLSGANLDMSITNLDLSDIVCYSTPLYTLKKAFYFGVVVLICLPGDLPPPNSLLFLIFADCS